MLENRMNPEEQWLQRFKNVVQSEIDLAGGHKRSAYRAVAKRLEMNEEYVYQIFNAKPKGRPKTPGKEVMAMLDKHYPLIGPVSTPTYERTYATDPPPSVADTGKPWSPNEHANTAFALLSQLLSGLDETGRRQAQAVLSNLVDAPSQHARLATVFSVVVQTSKRLSA